MIFYPHHTTKHPAWRQWRAWRPTLSAILAWLLFALLTATPVCGEDGEVGGFTIDPVAIITLDDQGRSFHFPSAIYFDPFTQETYVLNRGRGRLIVYGPEFFPRVSLGLGRGIESPGGIYVDSDGRLFVCQRTGGDKPARLTVFNAAFFKEKDIPIEGFPGAEIFLPRRVTIGLDGIIYIAGDQPGVVVLAADGTYLRHLSPMDRVMTTPLSLQKKEEGNTKKNMLQNQEEAFPPTAADLGLPAEMLPKTAKKMDEESPYSLGPVRVIEVSKDSSGNLYLLSQETSKIYVYSPKEEFLYSFGKKGGSSGKMSQPRGMALDENKQVVYIADYMRHTILVYHMRTGKFLLEFGGQGWSPGWFQYPTSVGCDHKGRIIVADTFNHRVQVLDVHFNVEAPSDPVRLPSSRIPSPPPADGD